MKRYDRNSRRRRWFHRRRADTQNNQRMTKSVGSSVQETDVGSSDTCAAFTIQVEAGAADIEAVLLDSKGKALCGGYYVSVQNAKESAP